MKKTLLLLLVITVLLLRLTPAHAAPVPLAEISAYLNSIRTAESPFTQTNADGSRAKGMLFIHRPNRMRLEYARPDKTLVLASGQQVAIFDAKSNQPPEQYPLKKTPLNLILGAQIDLSRAKMVVDHGEQDGLTTVTAQDPEHPEYGTIKLYFTANPVALKQWIVTDNAGARTRVVLDGLRFGQDYQPSLFSITMELQKRGF